MAGSRMDATTRAVPAPRTLTAPRRKRSALALAAVAVYCLSALATAQAQEAGTGGSSAGSGATGSPVTIAPTFTPTSKTPVFTTAPPTSKTPVQTTVAPTTTAPPETETPAPEVTTEPPTVTPKPAKTKKNVTEVAADAGSLTAETAAPEATTVERSADDSTSALSPVATPGSGVSYGGKTSDSSQATEEVTTKSTNDSTKTAIQFVAVAAGILGVVAAIAVSVHFHQKRRALARDYDDDDKYLNPAPQRPTTIDVTAPTTTKATTYDNYTTPQASGWRENMTAVNDPAKKEVAKPAPQMGYGGKPMPFAGEFRDSEDALAASSASTDVLAQSTSSGIVTTAATASTAATFMSRKAGENDVTGGEEADRVTAVGYVEEDFREPRVTVKHITRCRGQSEASTADGSDGLSQYGNGLLRSTFIDDEEDEGYTNTQMFAFSDSGSEADRDSARSEQSRGAGGAPSDVSEFLKFYEGPIVKTNTHVDVDVDVDGDDDEEDIVGRSTRASSLFDDVRASDFTVGHTSRMSTSSSIADFHDSMVDRPSELDEEEFEV